MALFGNRAMDTTHLRATSKMSLKLTCLAACGNDIGRAKELYSFISDGIELPDFEPETPDTFARAKQYAGDIFGWVREHGEEILQGYQMLKGLGGGAASASPSPIPPLP